MRSVLYDIREHITSSDILVSLLLPVTNAYWKLITKFGSDTCDLNIFDVSATFKSTTFEEVRHFYPVYGEAEELGDLLAEVTEDDVFFDVGAHVGIYTCIVGRASPVTEIHAFEPHPANRSRLQENMELNGVDASVYPYALADSQGEIEFDVDSLEPGALGHLSSSADESVSAEKITGDEVIARAGINPPTVLKIDVEGAELRVLEGLNESLDECRVIYCEVSDSLRKYGDSESELFDFLREHGFEIEHRFGDPDDGIDHYDIKARKS